MKKICSTGFFLLIILCVRNYSAALYGQNGYAFNPIEEETPKEDLSLVAKKNGFTVFLPFLFVPFLIRF